MISIVTAYYNRKKLFVRTLKSIQSQNFIGDFEFIAVDDGSREEERLEDLTKEFPFLKVIRLDPEKKWYKNSCIPFNIGFREAKGDKIIIQNPECYHYSPILQYVEDHLRENTYLSFGCFSLGKEETDNFTKLNIAKGIEDVINKHNYRFPMDGMNGWYNHSVYRSNAYHFCTAILQSDLQDLGGFDERYARGVGMDDDEFIYRVKLKGMNISFVDNILVLHQNHYIIDYNNLEKVHDEKAKLYAYNKKLFTHVTKYSNTWRAGLIEGQHEINLSQEQIVQRTYKELLDDKIAIIIRNRFSRKLSFQLLNIISKLF